MQFPKGDKTTEEFAAGTTISYLIFFNNQRRRLPGPVGVMDRDLIDIQSCVVIRLSCI